MKSNYAARLKPKPSLAQAEQIEKAKKEAADLATARAIVINCAALSLDEKDPFGATRLARHLARVQKLCDDCVDDYGNSAFWGALMILETRCPSIDWRKTFGLKVLEGE